MKKIVFLIAALLLVLACASSKALVDTEEEKSDLTVAKETITVKGVSFNMVTIPSGDFLMGSLSNEPDSFDNEHPQHRVSISAFQMGETEVTQGLWTAVMGNNPSYFSEYGDGCPVEQVSWNDVQIFIEKLNQIVPDGGFRLPTEAEWEYGCRAGTTTPFSSGKCLSTDQANYDGQNPLTGCAKGEFRKGLVPVAGFSPNAWGLYDMHGNVKELVSDWHDATYYAQSPNENPQGPASGSYRVNRGGSWGREAVGCRAANRSYIWPGDRDVLIGFRLLRMPE